MLYFSRHSYNYNNNHMLPEQLRSMLAHGGPITEQKIVKLDSLTDKQLLSEIGYLRATIAPDIKQKRKLASGKFETFPK